MTRSKKSSDFTESMNLDSLMDLLTCTVGFLLAVVILAVLDTRSVSLIINRPITSSPESGLERRMFFCSKGFIRPFFTDSLYDIATMNGKYTFQSIPGMVESANKKRLTDGYFYYFLDYEDETENYWWYAQRYRRVVYQIAENGKSPGETAEQLKSDTSQIARLLKYYEGKKIWCSFLVRDGQSIEVFREARRLASAARLASGWDPTNLDFPYSSGGGGSGYSIGVSIQNHFK